MAPRSQPHRLEHPLDASQVEALDGMLQDLYDDISNGSIDINDNLGGFPLEVEQGGTNSETPLSGSSIMISDGDAIVQGAILTDVTGSVLELPGVDPVPITPVANHLLLYAVTEQGHTQLSVLDPDGSVLRVNRDLVFVVRNTSGLSMPRGTLVNVNGSTGNTPTVRLADADLLGPPKVYAVGFTLEVIADNGFGLVMIEGLLTGLNTAAFSEGDLLYLSQSAGLFTATTPVAPAFSQAVGTVTRSHATQGTIAVQISDPLPATTNMAVIMTRVVLGI